MNDAEVYYWMGLPTEIVCKLGTIAQEWFSSYSDPPLPKAVCEQRSCSESRMRLLPLFEGRNDKMPYLFLENKKGMVSLGFCCEGSGKPAAQKHNGK